MLIISRSLSNNKLATKEYPTIICFFWTSWKAQSSQILSLVFILYDVENDLARHDSDRLSVAFLLVRASFIQTFSTKLIMKTVGNDLKIWSEPIHLYSGKHKFAKHFLIAVCKTSNYIKNAEEAFVNYITFPQQRLRECCLGNTGLHG